MRMCLDRMPKKELHGQHPVVTLPTKQALNQFESQQKTRPVPPTQSSNGPPPTSQRSAGPESMSRSSGGASQSSYQQQSHQPRLMSSNNGQSQYRPHMQSQGAPPGSGQAPQRVQQQPLMPHPPMMHAQQQQQQGQMRYPQQNQSQWNGPPRPGPNGPPRPGPGLNGPPGPLQHRPMVICFLVFLLRYFNFVLFKSNYCIPKTRNVNDMNRIRNTKCLQINFKTIFFAYVSHTLSTYKFAKFKGLLYAIRKSFYICFTF